MATAKVSANLLHEHRCSSCGQSWFCQEGECAPAIPGTTELVCTPCATEQAKVLLQFAERALAARNRFQEFSRIEEYECWLNSLPKFTEVIPGRV